MSSTVDALPQAPAAPRPDVAASGLGPKVSGTVTSLVGALGAGVGVAAAFHRFGPVHIGWLVPLLGIHVNIDGVGGLFTAVTGAVAVPVGLYFVGYARREHLPVLACAMMPLFVAAMVLVSTAGSVSTFLLAWELMALASVVLVLTEHRRDEVRAAGVFYAVMSQLGFAAILIGLLVLSSAAGADTFAGLAGNVDRVSATTRGVVFALTLVGFGSKAGLVPLHAWLPRAHPEAPSPVSALMSAAMVNLGIYGLIRFDLQLLGPGPRWWGLTLMTVGGASAVYGVLQASVATDLKRLLAYSTTENMGLIVLALGVATMLASSGAPEVAAIAMTAALLQVMCHAAFKTLAFLSAGSVLAGSGLRDLDRMGGLAFRMPATTIAFGVAALGASGLPVGAGFVSEWLLVQSLIHAPRHQSVLVALAMPLAVGAVALTIGLAVTAMVKAFGVGFLARPRSVDAATAREGSATMIAGMAIAGAACVVFAVAPLVVGSWLARVLAQLPAGRVGEVRLGAMLRLPGVAGSISPAWMLTGVALAVAVAAGVARRGSTRRPPRASVPLWACGGDELTARMQYTATSFAEPLQRVFDDVLRPDADIEVSHHVESQYLVDKISFQAKLTDTIEQRLYVPVERAVQVWASWVRRAHPGSVHLYLAYGSAGLLVVLVAAR